MKKIRIIIVLFMITASLSGCVGGYQQGMFQNALLGAGMGALTGVGANYALGGRSRNAGRAAVGGALVGGYMGALMIPAHQPSYGYGGAPPQGYYGGNPGAEAAYQRGVADRNSQAQQQLEQNMYQQGFYGK